MELEFFSSVSRLHVGSAEDPGKERCCGLAGEPDDPLPDPVHPGHRAQTQHRAFKIQWSVALHILRFVSLFPLGVCVTCVALPAGLIKYSELTEYLIRAVTGMQKELQEARCEASRMSTRCASLESDIRQLMGQEETSRRLQSENERMRRHLCSLQHEVTKLKDEKCDVYMRYTAAIEEKTAVGMRLHDLNLQVSAPD